MIRRWQEAVDPADLVYVLGDFAFGTRASAEHLVGLLNGTKVLIRGNHDRGYRAMEDIGFACCLRSAVVSLDGKSILLAHSPLCGPLPEGIDGVFHGHVHRAEGRRDIPAWNVNMCVELNDYAPVGYKRALKLLRRQMSERARIASSSEEVEGGGNAPGKDRADAGDHVLPDEEAPPRP